MIEIYTDGAFDPVTSGGAWAAVITENGKKRNFSGSAENTTSNRMEIIAALEGILKTPKDSDVVVNTDSQYLYGCASKGWQRRANTDLWKKMDAAVAERKVSWKWNERENEAQQEAHAIANDLMTSGKRAAGHAPAPETPKELTHLDESGKPRMVDVSEKADTRREAVAKGLVRMNATTFKRIKEGSIPKGNVLAVAQIASIMAAKQTPTLIPLCHPLLLNEIRVELSLDEDNNAIDITSTVKCTGKTGVEMEALTATAVAALTIYDMCKAIDRGMMIENIRLVKKSGGKSGTIVLD